MENFQRWMGDGIDGVVGPQTWGTLCSLPYADMSSYYHSLAC